MGKLLGVFLMIVGAVAFFYGDAIIPQYPIISDGVIQIIAILIFVIGVVVASFSKKSPRY